MNIVVGITGFSEGWQSYLEQEGVPYTHVSESFSLNDYSVIIAPSAVSSEQVPMIQSYVSKGGSLLCSAEAYSKIFSVPIAKKFVSYISFLDSELFSDVGIIRVNDLCTIPSNANLGKTQTKNSALLMTKHGLGTMIVLPFEADMLLADSRSDDWSFYSSHARLPFERVATISKRSLRILLSHSLEFLHHTRNLPYVHKWYYPDNARSVFCFRIDTDFGTREQIDELAIFLHRRHIPASWFLDVKSQEPFLDVYCRIDGNHEIGVHCYDHQHYREKKLNIRDDVDAALSILRSKGIEPKGFVAPYGQWSKELDDCIRNDFEYSSEFSYDYDSMPFQMQSGMLQIPIHPICIGSLKRHSYSSDAMKQYFDFVIDKKLALAEPIILYHHPRDGKLDVLEHIFHRIKEVKLPLFTMIEFAEWWRKRQRSSLHCEFQNDTLMVSADSNDESCTIHCTISDGREAFLQTPSTVKLESLPRKTRQPFVYPKDYVRIVRWNYRIPFIRTTDAIVKFFREGRKR
ncbi:MAG TPA: DUF2334 domain-containing protein [Bacteroidota bacterium]|nr:DUF2334 domain-containing protein [Bacteroidota bacterium]